MVSTLKKNIQNGRLFNRLKESLNDFVSGSSTQACLAEDETTELHNDGLFDNFAISGVHHLAKIVQVISRLSKKNDDRVRKDVDSVFAAVKNWVN